MAMNLESSAMESTAALLARRRQLLGGNLRVAYQQPLHIVRGSMQYLWDADGRRYLDGNSSIWTNLHGHNHSKMNAVITATNTTTTIV